jgi:hypothetical protein
MIIDFRENARIAMILKPDFDIIFCLQVNEKVETLFREQTKIKRSEKKRKEKENTMKYNRSRQSKKKQNKIRRKHTMIELERHLMAV